MRVVHIGFPKTATTFLQTSVFPQLPQGFNYPDNKTTEAFFRPIADHDDTIFDWEDSARRLAGVSQTHEHCLFSYEPLTGAHYRSAFVNRTLIARRLRQIGFDRVIITIRNQFDALESAYKQYVKSGGVLRFDDYVQFDPDKPRYLYPEYFDYLRIFRLYSETFGRDNVLILQHERLREPSFGKDLARFLAIEHFAIDVQAKINPSLSRDKTAILRVLNHLTYSSFQPSHLISKKISTAFFHRQLAALPMLNAAKSFFDTSKRTVIANYYERANQVLQDEACIVLAPQYPVRVGVHR